MNPNPNHNYALNPNAIQPNRNCLSALYPTYFTDNPPEGYALSLFTPELQPLCEHCLADLRSCKEYRTIPIDYRQPPSACTCRAIPPLGHNGVRRFLINGNARGYPSIPPTTGFLTNPLPRSCHRLAPADTVSQGLMCSAKDIKDIHLQTKQSMRSLQPPAVFHQDTIAQFKRAITSLGNRTTHIFSLNDTGSQAKRAFCIFARFIASITKTDIHRHITTIETDTIYNLINEVTYNFDVFTATMEIPNADPTKEALSFIANTRRPIGDLAANLRKLTAQISAIYEMIPRTWTSHPFLAHPLLLGPGPDMIKEIFLHDHNASRGNVFHAPPTPYPTLTAIDTAFRILCYTTTELKRLQLICKEYRQYYAIRNLNANWRTVMQPRRPQQFELTTTHTGHRPPLTSTPTPQQSTANVLPHVPVVRSTPIIVQPPTTREEEKCVDEALSLLGDEHSTDSPQKRQTNTPKAPKKAFAITQTSEPYPIVRNLLSTFQPARPTRTLTSPDPTTAMLSSTHSPTSCQTLTFQHPQLNPLQQPTTGTMTLTYPNLSDRRTQTPEVQSPGHGTSTTTTEEPESTTTPDVTPDLTCTETLPDSSPSTPSSTPVKKAPPTPSRSSPKPSRNTSGPSITQMLIIALVLPLVIAKDAFQVRENFAYIPMGTHYLNPTMKILVRPISFLSLWQLTPLMNATLMLHKQLCKTAAIAEPEEDPYSFTLNRDILSFDEAKADCLTKGQQLLEVRNPTIRHRLEDLMAQHNLESVYEGRIITKKDTDPVFISDNSLALAAGFSTYYGSFHTPVGGSTGNFIIVRTANKKELQLEWDHNLHRLHKQFESMANPPDVLPMKTHTVCMNKPKDPSYPQTVKLHMAQRTAFATNCERMTKNMEHRLEYTITSLRTLANPPPIDLINKPIPNGSPGTITLPPRRDKRGLLLIAGLVVTAGTVGKAIHEILDSAINYDRDEILATATELTNNAITTLHLATNNAITAFNKFASGITDMVNKWQTTTTLNTFRTYSNQLQEDFNTMFDSISSGVNRLSIISLAARSGKVSELALHPELLGEKANDLAIQEHIVLNQDFSKIQMTMMRSPGQYALKFAIPCIETQKKYRLYRVIPLPRIQHPNSVHLMPLAYTEYIAFAQESSEYVPLTPWEAKTCTTTNSPCIISHPISPEQKRLCGATQFYGPIGWNDPCQYHKPGSSGDYYRIFGNVTCYSITSPQEANIYCERYTDAPHEDGTILLNSTAGCFEFHPACRVILPDHSTIIPSYSIQSESKIGDPLQLSPGYLTADLRDIPTIMDGQTPIVYTPIKTVDLPPLADPQKIRDINSWGINFDFGFGLDWLGNAMIIIATIGIICICPTKDILQTIWTTLTYISPRSRDRRSRSRRRRDASTDRLSIHTELEPLSESHRQAPQPTPNWPTEPILWTSPVPNKRPTPTPTSPCATTPHYAKPIANPTTTKPVPPPKPVKPNPDTPPA